MMCAQRGYNCVITMAEPFSVERRKLMRMLGAKVIVTPKAGKGTGMVEKAAELADKHGWFLCHQFETESNWKFHEATTGKNGISICCPALILNYYFSFGFIDSIQFLIDIHNIHLDHIIHRSIA